MLLINLNCLLGADLRLADPPRQLPAVLGGELRGDVREVPGGLGPAQGVPGDPQVHGDPPEDQAGERSPVEAVSEW